MTGNDRQIAYWNEVAGPKWVGLQDAMERRLVPVEDLLLARAQPMAGETVLEIGCGTGTTTARLADLVGPTGHVTALDISRPMLGMARTRIGDRDTVDLIEADAANIVLEHRFDLLVSRFGVMFFEEPISAFRHLHGLLKPGGRLCVVAWAPIAENPHWNRPRTLVIDRLGAPKPRRLHAPGPLAFADAAYAGAVLNDAGFAEVSVRAEQVMLIGGSLDDEAVLAATMGPAGALLDEKAADEATRAELRAAFRAALPDYVDGSGGLPATVQMITAQRR